MFGSALKGILRKASTRSAWLALLLTLSGGAVLTSDSLKVSPVDSEMEQRREDVRRAIQSISTPELEARKARRRLMQQRGYADILHHVLRRDGLSALISSARLTSQLEYSLPRNTLMLYIPVRRPPVRDSTLPPFYSFSSGPMGVPLPEDRSFPEDPWKR
jgi:hypothetical protein